MKESDIIKENENGSFVFKDKAGFHVMLNNITHSVGDSSYDDESLAIARLNYFKPKTAQEIQRMAFNIQQYNRKTR
jgi:hypothetical protein